MPVVGGDGPLSPAGYLGEEWTSPADANGVGFPMGATDGPPLGDASESVDLLQLDRAPHRPARDRNTSAADTPDKVVDAITCASASSATAAVRRQLSMDDLLPRASDTVVVFLSPRAGWGVTPLAALPPSGLSREDADSDGGAGRTGVERGRLISPSRLMSPVFAGRFSSFSGLLTLASPSSKAWTTNAEASMAAPAAPPAAEAPRRLSATAAGDGGGDDEGLALSRVPAFPTSRGVTWPLLAVILAGDTVATALSAVPRAVASLGLFVTALLLVFMAAIAVGVGYLLAALLRAHPAARSLPALLRSALGRRAGVAAAVVVATALVASVAGGLVDQAAAWQVLVAGVPASACGGMVALAAAAAVAVVIAALGTSFSGCVILSTVVVATTVGLLPVVWMALDATAPSTWLGPLALEDPGGPSLFSAPMDRAIAAAAALASLFTPHLASVQLGAIARSPASWFRALVASQAVVLAIGLAHAAGSSVALPPWVPGAVVDGSHTPLAGLLAPLMVDHRGARVAVGLAAVVAAAAGSTLRMLLLGRLLWQAVFSVVGLIRQQPKGLLAADIVDTAPFSAARRRVPVPESCATPPAPQMALFVSVPTPPPKVANFHVGGDRATDPSTPPADPSPRRRGLEFGDNTVPVLPGSTCGLRFDKWDSIGDGDSRCEILDGCWAVDSDGDEYDARPHGSTSASGGASGDRIGAACAARRRQGQGTRRGSGTPRLPVRIGCLAGAVAPLAAVAAAAFAPAAASPAVLSAAAIGAFAFVTAVLPLAADESGWLGCSRGISRAPTCGGGWRRVTVTIGAALVVAVGVAMAVAAALAGLRATAAVVPALGTCLR